MPKLQSSRLIDENESVLEGKDIANISSYHSVQYFNMKEHSCSWLETAVEIIKSGLLCQRAGVKNIYVGGVLLRRL